MKHINVLWSFKYATLGQNTNNIQPETYARYSMGLKWAGRSVGYYFCQWLCQWDVISFLLWRLRSDLGGCRWGLTWRRETACLAALSTVSFPWISTCAGIHINVMEVFVLASVGIICEYGRCLIWWRRRWGSLSILGLVGIRTVDWVEDVRGTGDCLKSGSEYRYEATVPLWNTRASLS